MIIPIKCFTCGFVLADKYAFYCQEVRARKTRVGVPLEPSYLTSSTTEKRTIEGTVLDEIGVTKVCCRTAMLTHVDIM